MGIPVLNSITSEEYLEMESISDIKHEFYKGEVFAMAGELLSITSFAETLMVNYI